jgi:hypothetical protein
MSEHQRPAVLARETSPLLTVDPVTCGDQPLLINPTSENMITPTVSVSPERSSETGNDHDGVSLLTPPEDVTEDAVFVADLAERPPMRSAIFTMLPAFMSYAALVTLQDNIKQRLGIEQADSPGSYEFSFAVSWLYLGNLIFRVMHNIIFSKFTPRHRVCIANLCLAIACTILALAYYTFNSKSVAWVFVAYMMGGVGIGTFESNLISSITPLGHKTKVWAQLGISFGFNGVSIGAFVLYSAFPNDLGLQCGTYLFIAAVNLAGMAFFLFAVPDIEFGSSQQGLRLFWSDVKRFREWIPQVLPYALPMALNMAALGFFSAVQLYIYNVSDIPLWWGSRTTIPENVFRAIYNAHSLVGDAAGRKIAYARKTLTHPAWYLVFSAIGGGLILSKVALVAPLGMLFVMFANGSMYATATKHIDVQVPQRFNLIALSFWLFAGDVGSFIGSNCVNGARVAVGEVPTAAPR